jgi:hypothetical protein
MAKTATRAALRIGFRFKTGGVPLPRRRCVRVRIGEVAALVRFAPVISEAHGRVFETSRLSHDVSLYAGGSSPYRCGYDKPTNAKNPTEHLVPVDDVLEGDQGRSERRAGSLPECVAAFSRGTPELTSASGLVVARRVWTACGAQGWPVPQLKNRIGEATSGSPARPPHAR